MPTLESRLVIGAKDETGGAFAKIQEHISKLDRQVATFDKLMTATRKVAGANDPMIAGIDRAAKALQEEKAAMESLSRAMASGVVSAEEMAGVQGRLARETTAATRAMAVQGAEAVRTSRKIKQERGAGGGLGALFVAGGAYEAVKKTAEASADLEQAKFKVRAASPGDKTESPFAEALAEELAQKYPNLTQQKLLDTYMELRANAGTPVNKETARRNMMAMAQGQTAAMVIGQEFTPEDAQNLMKSVEGTGRANDPAAIGKMVDRYIRAKLVFGSAITTDKIRDFVQNAKTAGLALDDEALDKLIVRMTEGNASRLGNETAQTMQTLVGGHATKQTARWLQGLGLSTGFTSQGGGNATIHGLKGSDLLQVDQMQWANEILLPALIKKGVLSDANIKKREAFLRKSDPNIDPKALRERAESGLIAGAIAPSGMRSTVTDNLAHAIANELLINRDVQQMKSVSGAEQLAADVGKNPVAALAQLTGALTDFAATVGGPLMGPATAGLEKLTNAVKFAEKELAAFDKAHPDAAPYANAAVAGGGGLLAGWAGWKALSGVGRGILGALGLGGGAAGGAEAAASSAGLLAGLSPVAVAAGAAAAAAAAHPGVYQALKAGNPAFGALGGDLPYSPSAGAPMQLPGATPATPAGAMPYLPTYGRDVHSPQNGPYSYYPTKSPAEVSVSGEAQVEHTVHVDVSLEPGLMAKINQVVNSLGFTVPLIGGGSGRMDSDAGPHRGGIGSM